MPTEEEAERRRVYEADAGLAEGERVMETNLNGRIILPPDSLETIALILDHVGLSNEKKGEVIEHEKEHIEEARRAGAAVQDVIFTFIKTEGGRATVHIETRVVANSKDVLRDVISAPGEPSDYDYDMLNRLDG
jgi:hypothetical protein